MPSPLFQPGDNIAMKVPAAEFEAVVVFYERTLGFRVESREAETVRFDYGGGKHLEPLPEGMKAFWIKNPAGVVHLVTEE